MNDSSSIWRGVGFCLAVLLSGCASITNTETQQISVSARDKAGFAVSGADCLWKNTRGEGQFQTPAVISVRRDYAALHIICRKAGLSDALDAVNSKATSAMFGNILAGGPIGAAIDHSSGTAYAYPPAVTVWFASLTGAVGTPAKAMPEPVVVRAAPPPVASGFARLEDVDAVPSISGSCRERYRAWLGWGNPKAYAVGPKGHCGFTTGTHPPSTDLPIVDPSARALAACARVGSGDCKLYAVNDVVVWKP